jgi:DNA recombination protein RmuC
VTPATAGIVFLAALCGAALSWVLNCRRVAALRSALHESESRATAAEATAAERRAEVLAERQRSADIERRAVRTAEEMRDAFRAASSEALRENNDAFLELAATRLQAEHVQSQSALREREQAITALLEPVRESLGRVGTKIEELDRDRRETQGRLAETLRTVSEGQAALRDETTRLVTALKRPTPGGRWGEFGLRRACEVAGMVDRCHFREQPGVEVRDDEDAVLQRPDLAVDLPGEKLIVVDSKVPLSAFMDALEAVGEDREAHLDRFAKNVSDHVKALGGKAYWSQFEASPEFVVMYLPTEALFSAALERIPTLIEDAATRNVVVASPTTLIALLRAVGYGWREERLAEGAREVAEAGAELHRRLGTLLDHVARLGRALDGSVRAYNQVVGSLEGRVVPSARRLSDLAPGAVPTSLRAPTPIDRASRPLVALEAAASDDEVA